MCYSVLETTASKESSATQLLARFLLEITSSTVTCSFCAMRTSLFPTLLGEKRRCIELKRSRRAAPTRIHASPYRVPVHWCALFEIRFSLLLRTEQRSVRSKGRKPLCTHVQNVKGTTLPRKGDRYADRQALLSKISRNPPHWTLRLNCSASHGDA